MARKRLGLHSFTESVVDMLTRFCPSLPPYQPRITVLGGSEHLNSSWLVSLVRILSAAFTGKLFRSGFVLVSGFYTAVFLTEFSIQLLFKIFFLP